MRLGQLARQLDITPDKIVHFLGSREIAIDNSSNARIDDAHVELIIQHFAPGNNTVLQQVNLPAPPAETVAPPENQSNEELGVEMIPEVIKAPKIELPGLRVLGKIELPEKKKPEPIPEPEEQKEKPSTPQVPPRRPQRNYPLRERKNPIALAREREDQENKRKMEEKREQEKQRKAAFYQKRLKPQAPTKAARLVREEYAEMPPLEPERPRTLWGRFMRWLNT